MTLSRYHSCSLPSKVTNIKALVWMSDAKCCTGLFCNCTIAESFYDVKYWTSIITSNVRQINLSNENIKNKHWCFQISKIVSQKNHFGILIYILSLKHLFEIYFKLLRRNNKLKINNFLTNIWRNNSAFVLFAFPFWFL